ncbi:Beta-xylosidase [Raoultella terrigena]|uniref:Beta-xylosidase n=1 Tax=Raoultella terrigena TaxID=577 RepID=A0A4U9D4Y2_RAOTE|nr:Beta-xylosidase [Raoultella terrigena]
MLQLDHNVPSWPLHEQPIPVPDEAQSLWLRVDVDHLVYRYSYSFDGENWHRVPVDYAAWKLSDDYIGGPRVLYRGVCRPALRGHQRRRLLR